MPGGCGEQAVSRAGYKQRRKKREQDSGYENRVWEPALSLRIRSRRVLRLLEEAFLGRAATATIASRSRARQLVADEWG